MGALGVGGVQVPEEGVPGLGVGGVQVPEEGVPDLGVGRGQQQTQAQTGYP